MANDDDVLIDRYAASNPHHLQINKGATNPALLSIRVERAASNPLPLSISQPAQAVNQASPQQNQSSEARSNSNSNSDD